MPDHTAVAEPPALGGRGAGWVCTEILRAAYEGDPPTKMSVNRGVYDMVATEKARELEHGNPLMLLGLDLVIDDSIYGNQAQLD